MRVIAGQYRGRRLQAPQGLSTRPTTDRVKESLMSVIASARDGFEGARVLDAFAGSGGLGIEALSRGAASACFFERDAAAAKIIAANLAAIGLDARDRSGAARLVRDDVLKRPPVQPYAPFDLVFLDPPYAFEAQQIFAFLDALAATGTLANDALVSYEHAVADNAAVDAQLARPSAGFSLDSRRSYGDTAIDIIRYLVPSTEEALS